MWSTKRRSWRDDGLCEEEWRDDVEDLADGICGEVGWDCRRLDGGCGERMNEGAAQEETFW